MKARYKLGLILLGLIIMLWTMIVDEARMEYGAKIKILDAVLVDHENRITEIKAQFDEILGEAWAPNIRMN
ncbi:MAG: hypothetical protein Q7S42_01345 [Candidatus Omnitrophota bacterium]|nr:hypothetical protein [Candidatus Omnitrophota bacterium]